MAIDLSRVKLVHLEKQIDALVLAGIDKCRGGSYYP